MEESAQIYKEGESVPYIRFLTPSAGAQLQLPILNQNPLIMPYFNLQLGPQFSHFDDLNTELVCKTRLGTKLLFFVAKNNLAILLDINLNAKIHPQDSSKKDFALNLSAGLAF